MTSPSNWFTESDAEKAARALDPEAWAILDSDSIGMMTRRKVSLEQARRALGAVNPFERPDGYYTFTYHEPRSVVPSPQEDEQ